MVIHEITLPYYFWNKLITATVNRTFLLKINAFFSYFIFDHSYNSPRYNEFGYLRPISIQTKKGQDAYTVTPADEHLWKLAKRMFEGSNSILQSFSGRVNIILE